jgi:hypothetical protein
MEQQLTDLLFFLFVGWLCGYNSTVTARAT